MTAPDFEALVWDRIRHLGGVTVWAYDGNQEWPGHVEVCELQIDVRASSKKRARDRAYAARDLVLALSGEDWKEAALVVNDSSVTSGPFWLPDADGAPRYVLRMSVRGHVQAVAVPKRKG